MSIVAATNFSEASRRAALAAAALARARRVPLWLVHQMQPVGSREQGEVLRQAVRALLQSEAERLREHEVQVETVVLESAGVDAVAEFAMRHDASLIVAGPNRPEPPAGALGGDLDRMAHGSAVPLLVVKDADAIREWAARKRPLRVVLGVDRSAPFNAARDYVAELRKYGEVELIAARVFHPFEECARFGLALPYVLDQIPPPLEDALTREVHGLVGTLPDGRPVPVVLQPSVGRYADQLVEVARKVKGDLVLVGTHHRSGMAKLWSVSHHTLRLAEMSVLTVPSAVATQQAIPTLRRILVATDFSEAGNSAIPWAFSMVARGGVVHLVHVDEAVEDTAHREHRLQRLRMLVPVDAQSRETMALCEVLPSQEVATTLVQTAERLDVDAICLASKASATVLGHLFGSVANDVLRRTRRPVLVVRPPEQ